VHSRKENGMPQCNKLSPEQSFEEVLEKVQPMITSIFLKLHIYKDYDYYRHLASIAVWEAWCKVDPLKGKFSAYIYTTVKGELMKELTKEATFEELHAPMDDETINYVKGFEISPKSPVILEALLAEVKEEERAILLLYYVEGYTYEEIAQVLHLSVSAIKKRRTRIMTKLRGLRSSIVK